MVVGVKFCGGCNPRYDRKEYLEQAVKATPGADFQIAEEGRKYDLLLVIGGCPSCCASYEQYHFDEVAKVWDSAHSFDIDK